jgi:uncharacterized protein (TIGR03437 family)
MRRSTLLVAWAVACCSGRCASLALTGQAAAPGQVLVTTVSFTSQGQAVSGIQFDLTADAGISFGILPGTQIGTSAKILYTAALPNGGLRVLITGTNQAPIGDGDLIRPLLLVDPAAAPGPAQIRISNPLGTDPSGGSIPVGPVSATVQIQAGPAVQFFSGDGVVSAASLLSGPVSPGEIVTIFGRADLAAASAVQFNGASAPILYAGTGQVNAIVPFGLDTSGAVKLEILSPKQSLGVASLPAATVSPALFTVGSTGSGPGAILNQDFSVNSFSNAASAGSIVMIFGTGFGALIPPAADGQLATAAAPTAQLVSATIAGVPAEVIYAGAAPGLIAGVVQINVQIPPGLPANPAAVVSLSIGGVTSGPGVTVSTR